MNHSSGDSGLEAINAPPFTPSHNAEARKEKEASF